MSVAFSQKADQIFVAGIENNIKAFDLRNKGILYALEGHYDSVTGLSLSPDGNHLLSNSMDNTGKVIKNSFETNWLMVLNRLIDFHLFSPNLGCSTLCSTQPFGSILARKCSQFRKKSSPLQLECRRNLCVGRFGRPSRVRVECNDGQHFVQITGTFRFCQWSRLPPKWADRLVLHSLYSVFCVFDWF